MLNKVMLIGHLGADPEIRHTQDGRPIANLRLATSERWKDKNSGERMERTEWHSVVIFNENLAKIAEQYLKKGSKVYIEGKLATRKWTDKDGADRYSTEVVLQAFNGQIVLLDGKGEDDGRSNRSEDSYGKTQKRSNDAAQAPQRSTREELDDQIPF